MLLHEKRSTATAMMTLMLSLLAIFAAAKGIFDGRLYDDLYQVGAMPKSLVFGCIAQDIVSLPLGILLLVCSLLFLKRQGIKTMIGIIGLAWYFFYAFGLYVIQGNYTSIYLVYMAIFGLSIYSMIWGVVSFNQAQMDKCTLPKGLRVAILCFLLLILSMLFPVWLIRISPDILKHIHSDTYGVYILDLCVVFPAFAQIAFMLMQRKAFANILAGFALIKTFTLCLSWGFGEWYTAISKGVPIPYDMALTASGLTLIGLALIVPYFVKLKTR